MPWVCVLIGLILLWSSISDVRAGYTSISRMGKRCYRRDDPATFWFHVVVGALLGGILFYLATSFLIRHYTAKTS